MSGIEYIQSRGISQETCERAGVTFSTDRRGNPTVVFNYFEQGELVDRKVRLVGQKMFFHDFTGIANRKTVLYNLDAIAQSKVCYITEGEFDALAMIEAGFAETVSVPAGAGNSSTPWLDDVMQSHFENKERIYICVDNDAPGQRLRDLLFQKFGYHRCFLVSWPTDCKDANDTLKALGAGGLQHAISQALPLSLGASDETLAEQATKRPSAYETLRYENENKFTNSLIRDNNKQAPQDPREIFFNSSNSCSKESLLGVADIEPDLDDLFRNGLGKGFAVGLGGFDEQVTFETGRFMIVTGRPGDGKSELVDEIVLRLCLRHGWKAAYFSPENHPLKYHVAKLVSKLTGFAFKVGGKMSEELYGSCKRWLSENICHISPGEPTLQRVLETAALAVQQRGVQTVVIDPLNSLCRDPPDASLSEHDWYLKICNTLLGFAHQHDVLLILVAHPRKVDRSLFNGERRRVEMNDISGSADFANKCDFCLCVDRDDELGVVTVYVDKVKFKHLGTRGKFHLCYDKQSGRYVPCEVRKLPNSEFMGDKKYEVTPDYSEIAKVWVKPS